RPVVLTALAAILAMIPLSRSAFWGPMAITIMGGLFVATFLTLLYLPGLYALWFRKSLDETGASEVIDLAPQHYGPVRPAFPLAEAAKKLKMSEMTLISETAEPDTRERILAVAERFFRQIGYKKTTVADIAKELRMSPANVYRFFDSKKSIHEGVARILMGEVEEAAQVIMARPASAAGRLRE